MTIAIPPERAAAIRAAIRSTPPIQGDRVTITEFLNDGMTHLDGWLIRQTGPVVVISGSPDDDGRDDYDTNMHMRAYFRLGKNVRIRHYGGNK